ncbi:hypothetical protein, partial [Streptomyces sp. NPDC058280]|uniref:hypothetical protein n=1 Tax=Streptomyces sp. NPDC058280 TaxID=3346419 RepID=UPI0036DFA79A
LSQAPNRPHPSTARNGAAKRYFYEPVALQKGTPAWQEQLAEGTRLVVPLEMGGYTRSLTLVRRGDVLHCEHCNSGSPLPPTRA